MAQAHHLDLANVAAEDGRKISKQDVMLEQDVDPNVIGGFKLKIADKQIDETIQSKLKDLKLKFTTNA